MSCKNPLVTVITVSYNSEIHIKDTIESVLSQSYDNMNYVIIDGNSCDRTIEIIKSYESNFAGKLRWISENDNGIYYAMNKGLNYVDDTDSYVVFLNSDDYFDSKDTINNMLSCSDNKDFLYGKLKLVDDDFRHIVGCEIDLKLLAFRKICYHPTVFTKKSVFTKIGNFSENYVIAGDYDFFVRVFMDSSITKKFIPITVTAMRIGGVSSTDVKKSLVEKRTIIKNYYPLFTYILSVIYVSLYELPRNRARIILGNSGCLNVWRDVRTYAKRIITGNTNNRSKG